MKIYRRLLAEVTEDICLSSRQDMKNIYQSLNYIPGRIVWGAIASMTGIKPGTLTPPSKWFMDIFYSGNVVFSNLYPIKNNYRVKPVPLSARTKKICPGFKSDKVDYAEDGIGAGIWDYLLKPMPDEIGDDIKYENFYYGNPPTCETVLQPFNQQIQHERDVNSGTTKEGMLFSRITIPRKSFFAGYISIDDSLDINIEKKLTDNINFFVEKEIEIPIGRAPGRIKLKLDNETRYIAKDDIKDDILLKNNKFIITCYSDTIIMDAYHRYLPYIPGELIQEKLNDILNTCSLMDYYFSSIKVIQGWNGAYRRPQEEQIAISIGSTFCYTFEAKDDHQSISYRLTDLQNKGIGLLRSQGFGEIKINDPFHLQDKCI
ncbi:hypothetical protein HY745_06120 [Candidatus Desantisbacteria bacterium]|nr:hypothetical protein [Candidatus Desantisbacteria bacterium]